MAEIVPPADDGRDLPRIWVLLVLLSGPELRALPRFLEIPDRPRRVPVVNRAALAVSLGTEDEVLRLPIRVLAGPELQDRQSSGVQRNDAARALCRLRLPDAEDPLLEINLTPRQPDELGVPEARRDREDDGGIERARAALAAFL